MVKSKLLNQRHRVFKLRSVSGASLLIIGIIVLIICSIEQAGKLEFLELSVFDLMMRSRSKTELDSRITVVGIEESDIKTWQQSTFSDRLLAELLAKLQKYRPAVIGLDIYLDTPQPPGNALLLEQLEAENVIAVRKIDRAGGISAPPNVPLRRIGFDNFLLDPDGKIRRNFMAFQQGDRTIYSFALQMSAFYLDARERLKLKPDRFELGETAFGRLQANSGGYQLSVLDVLGAQTILNYRSPGKAARRLSFTHVLSDNFNPDWITGKIIIIGYGAPSKKDVFSTPFEVRTMPGVVIQAHMVSQIISTVIDGRPLFIFLPQWGEVCWIVLWSISGAVLVWRNEHPLRLGAGLIAALGVLSGACFLGFLAAVWIPVIPAIIALFITTGVISVYKTFHQSSVDELTGLANREQLIELLQKSVCKPQSSIALLSIEIERLKTINDSLGKQVGDRLLILVSQRIQNSIRDRDRLARVNTAEFSVVLFSLKDRAYAVAIAKRIQQELAHPYNFQGQELVITTSIGIAFNEPGQSIEAEELLRNSNLAADRARILGKNQYAVFAPQMHSETVAQWQLENDLRRGIEQQEFQLYYQPIIDFKTNRIAGFEALVRWISPTRGLVTPIEFIPLAEATGLIIPLGNWILHEACRQMHYWHQQFDRLPELTISVNLSSHQFSPFLVKRVAEILSETQLSARCLKLEITESAMIDNLEEAIALLQQLKTLGIKLSIDDFGTGYSSLSYLQQFCADTLKVDRSFVNQIESSVKNKAIVDIIITLAHKLEMDVIAEGIETEEHRAILKSLECEYGQGYLFAKPLSSTEATKLLVQQFATHL